MHATFIPPEIEFLLCASRAFGEARELFEAFSKLAPTSSYVCTTNATGHDQEVTAKFWEIMQYINLNYKHDGGFVLWFESDMIPIKRDWVNRLTQEWLSAPNSIIMGLYLPEGYYRGGGVVTAHINGGGCYRKDFINYIPREGQRPIFDVELFPFVKKTERYICSTAFAFSTICKIRRDILDPNKVMLHGLYQDRDVFIKRCIEIATNKSVFKTWKWFLQEMYWSIQLRPCCGYRYWKRHAFYCPIHPQITK